MIFEQPSPKQPEPNMAVTTLFLICFVAYLCLAASENNI